MNLLEIVFQFIFKILKQNIIVSSDDQKTYMYNHISLLWTKTDKQTAHDFCRYLFDKICEEHIISDAGGKIYKSNTLVKLFDMCYLLAINFPNYQKHCTNVRSSMNNTNSLPYDKNHCVFDEGLTYRRGKDVYVCWSLGRKKVELSNISTEESCKIQKIYDILGDDLFQFLINVMTMKHRNCMVVKTTQRHLLFNFIVRLFNCEEACHVFRDRLSFKSALENCPILVINETNDNAKELMNLHTEYLSRTDELIETPDYMDVVKLKFQTLIIIDKPSDFYQIYELGDVSELADLCSDNTLDFFFANVLGWCIQVEENCLNYQEIATHEITHVASI
jgi:hypothetical protein